MDESADPPDTGVDPMVERGKTYVHAEHGRVEVTGIWKGVNQVDSSRQMEEMDTIIVRYLIKEDGKPVVEQVNLLDEFLEAVE